MKTCLDFSDIEKCYHCMTFDNERRTFKCSIEYFCEDMLKSSDFNFYTHKGLKHIHNQIYFIKALEIMKDDPDSWSLKFLKISMLF